MARFEIKAKINGKKVIFGVECGHIVIFHNCEKWDDDAKHKLGCKSGRGQYNSTDLGAAPNDNPTHEQLAEAVARWDSTAKVIFDGEQPKQPTQPKQPKVAQDKPTEDKPKKFVAPTKPTTTPSSGDGSAMGALGALFGGIKEEVKVEVLQVLEPYINQIQRVEHIITLPSGAKTKMDKVLHDKFDKILKLVCAHKNVYLFGEAGTGKSEIAKQIAEAMQLPYYQQDKVESMYEFIGIMDAHGRFHETPLFKGWTQGGIVCLDEFDGYLPGAVLKFNGGLSQGVMVFGDGKAYPKHKDCYIIATGNTNCQGADNGYVTRFEQDASALNRFVKIKIDYCQEIERKCANKDLDLCDFVRNVRNTAKQKGFTLVMSYRDITDMYDLDQLLGTEDAILSRVVYDLDEDSARILLRALPDYDNKWFKTAKKIAEKL